MINSIASMILYRTRGGLFEAELLSILKNIKRKWLSSILIKILIHFKTFGMVALSFQLYYIADRTDWVYWVSIVCFWASLAWTDWIGNFDPYTRLTDARLDDGDFYDPYIKISYDKFDTMITNLIGLSIKGGLIGVGLVPILSWWSLHNVITLPLMQYIGWTIDKKNKTANNYAEFLYGFCIFIH